MAPVAVYVGFLGFASLFVSLNTLMAYLVIAGFQVVLGLVLRALFVAIQARSLKAILPGVSESVRVRDHRPLSRQVVAYSAVIVILVWLLITGSSVPWAPPERIETSTGHHVGYVLGSEDGWLSILLDSPRELARVRLSEVEKRTVCRLGPAPDRRAISYLSIVRRSMPGVRVMLGCGVEESPALTPPRRPPASTSPASRRLRCSQAVRFAALLY